MMERLGNGQIGLTVCRLLMVLSKFITLTGTASQLVFPIIRAVT